jgi:hypothetical protein
MSLKGNLESFDLTIVFQLLSSNKKTGVLRVSSGSNEARVYMIEGAIIFATGSDLNNRLGYLLRNKGIITQDQLDESLKISEEREQALGNVLVDQKYIDMRTLKKFIGKQAENVVYELFFWNDGEFEYKDIQPDLRKMVINKMNAMQIVMEATRRIDQMAIFKKRIPDENTVFEVSINITDLGDIVLNDDELAILKIINGKRSIKEIIKESGFFDYRIYKNLTSLIAAGFIKKM